MLVVALFCLDHLCYIGLLACGWTIRVPLGHPRSVGPPGWSRTPRVRNVHLGVRGPAPQSARSSGNPRARASSRRSRGLSDVLAGQRRHDMREAVPPCKTIGWVERGGRTAPDAVRPRRPTLPIPPRLAPSRAPERDSSGPSRTTPRITPGKRTRTPPNNSTGEEDASEQTVHHNLRAPRLQNHPRIIFRVCYASFAPLRSSTLHCTRRKGVAERKGRSRRSGEGVKFPGPGLADRGRDRTRAGPRPGVGALARVGLTGRNPAGITTTLRGVPGRLFRGWS